MPATPHGVDDDVFELDRQRVRDALRQAPSSSVGRHAQAAPIIAAADLSSLPGAQVDKTRDYFATAHTSRIGDEKMGGAAAEDDIGLKVHAAQLGSLKRVYQGEELHVRYDPDFIHRRLIFTIISSSGSRQSFAFARNSADPIHFHTVAATSPRSALSYADIFISPRELCPELGLLFASVGGFSELLGSGRSLWLRLHFPRGKDFFVGTLSRLCVNAKSDLQYVAYEARCQRPQHFLSIATRDAHRPLALIELTDDESCEPDRRPSVLVNSNDNSEQSTGRRSRPGTRKDADIDGTHQPAKEAAWSLSDSRRADTRSQRSSDTLSRLAPVLYPPPDDDLQIVPDAHGSAPDRSMFEPSPVPSPTLLFVYPQDDVNGTAVPITSADLSRLQGPYYLNDRLIDFDLQHIQFTSGLSEERRRAVHVFSCLFYGALCEDHGHSAGCDFDRLLLDSSCKGSFLFTRDVDIFSKDYLVVAIHEHIHWFLAVICHPRKMLQECGPGDGGAGSAEKEPACAERKERRRQLRQHAVVAIMDSLGTRQRPQALQRLKRFLLAEALSRKLLAATAPRLHSAMARIAGVHVRVPLQTNGVDCGLFVGASVHRMYVEGFEAFFERGVLDNSLERWYPSDAASQRRSRLLSLALDIGQQYQHLHPLHSGAEDDDAADALEVIDGF